MSAANILASLKEALLECPICLDHYDDSVRIPRRLPCCLQTLCQPCLKTYSRDIPKITCPMCRQDCDLPGGVTSLPKEQLILRFLEHLKTSLSSPVPFCSRCEEPTPASAKCDTCVAFLCTGCLFAHLANRGTKRHVTVTFEQARSDQIVRRSTIRQGRSEQSQNGGHIVSRKISELGKRMEELSSIRDKIVHSKTAVVDDINHVFDDLVEKLQQRRGKLLSQVESKVEREVKVISRAIESHKVTQFKLIEASKSPQKSLRSILEEKPQDVKFVRRGVSFVPANIQNLASTIMTGAGLVRTVTFTPMERPRGLDEESHCNSINLEPSETQQAAEVKVHVVSARGSQEECHTGSQWDQVVVLQKDKDVKHIICPYMEYDFSTASDDIIATSGSTVSNAIPSNPISNTGCRIRAQRHVLLTPSLDLQAVHRIMFQMKVTFKLKQPIPDRKNIFQISFVSNPMDVAWSQTAELNLELRTCNQHKNHRNRVCLFVMYDGKDVFCCAIGHNQAGVSCDLHLGFLFDRATRQIDILGESCGLLASVSNVVFERALWPILYLGRPEWTSINSEIISGNKVQVSQALSDTLTTALFPQASMMSAV
ncbi:uncharacterized protein LOC124141690 [Haliotis rufescens]|uniref:uncharacterized protein LOC124141690 n=1 Tax=Haliotis rufescens TaxID=6454 RepID=UPI00201E7D7F|nr:uncharacterized protein LOC124141690 [Haliotis rufescens]XP_046365695.2 uncharacterized protein LOC124141690 [Haliotis rufescens]XP_046365696.2 uncharacterized protein LOC124141690 [Haliotis rufescens]